MRCTIFYFLLLFRLCSVAAIITDIIPINKQPGLYQKIELAIATDYKSADVRNYFDPSKIAIEAHFTSPSGQKVQVNAFYFIDHSMASFPYQRLMTWHPWRVRFCPNEIGQWSYYLVAIENDSTKTRTADSSFTCVNSDNPGFVKVASNKNFLEFENGKSFFGVGMDMQSYGFAYGEATFVHYNYWIPRFSREGGNTTRIWMRPSDYELESDTLGAYRMDKAYELDKVFELLERYHIYTDLVIVNTEQISNAKSLWGSWSQNPYSSLALKSNKEFFSDARAIKHFKNKLRYIQSRWGYSTSLLSYELINEIDHIDNDFTNDPSKFNDPSYFNLSDQKNVTQWVNAMCNLVKSTYPVHLTCVSLSNGCDTKYPQYLKTDIINAHSYSAEKYAEYQRNYMVQKNIHECKRPFLMTEYGEDHRAICWMADRNYLSYHNGLWSGLFSGAASGYLFFNSQAKFYNDKWADTLVGKSWMAARKFLAGEQFNEALGFYEAVGNTMSAYEYFVKKEKYVCKPLQTGKKAPPDAPPCENFGFANDWAGPENIHYFSSGVSTSKERDLEVFALKKPQRVIGWVHNKNYYWYNLPGTQLSAECPDLCFKSYNPNAQSGSAYANDSITIYNLSSPGKYRVEWWSTQYNRDINEDGQVDVGGLFLSKEIETKEHKITFVIPSMKDPTKENSPFAQDYAFKIIFIEK